MQLERQHVVDARGRDLVEQRVGLHRHHEQQHERREHVDEALHARAGIRPHEIDGDVGAAIARRRDAPEDQNPEQELAEIVGVRNRGRENIAQQDRDEDVGRDEADEDRGDHLDRIDETIHRGAAPPAGSGLGGFRRCGGLAHGIREQAWRRDGRRRASPSLISPRR